MRYVFDYVVRLLCVWLHDKSIMCMISWQTYDMMCMTYDKFILLMTVWQNLFGVWAYDKFNMWRPLWLYDNTLIYCVLLLDKAFPQWYDTVIDFERRSYQLCILSELSSIPIIKYSHKYYHKFSEVSYIVPLLSPFVKERNKQRHHVAELWCK